MNDLQWIEDVEIPNYLKINDRIITQGTKFLVNNNSGGSMRDKEYSLVLEIMNISKEHNIITYYVTSENIRYHNTEFTSDFKTIDKLVSTNYYQEYNGEHIE